KHACGETRRGCCCSKSISMLRQLSLRLAMKALRSLAGNTAACLALPCCGASNTSLTAHLDDERQLASSVVSKSKGRCGKSITSCKVLQYYSWFFRTRFRHSPGEVPSQT